MNQATLAGIPASLNARDVLGIVMRRLWVVVIIMTLALGLSWYVSKRTPRRWKATGELLLVQRVTAVVATPQANVAAPLVETIETQIALLQGYEIAHRTINLLKNEALNRGLAPDTLGISEEMLQKQLTVTTQSGTNLMDVSVEAESGERAKQLANALCTTFVDYKKEVTKENARDTITELEGQARRAREQMLNADREEVVFKQSHHMADVPMQINAAIGQYLTRDTEVATLKQELVSEEAKLGSLSKRLQEANGAIRSGTGVRDDLQVLGLQSQLNNLEIERAKMALKYTPEFPGILPDLDTQISDIKLRLAKAVQGTLDNLKPSLQAQGLLFEEYKQVQTTVLFTRAKFQAAVKLRDLLRSQTGALPQASIEYTRLAKNAETARSLNTAIQEALQTINLNRDMSSGNVQIAQYAHAPSAPFLPNTTRDLTFGGTIGLFLSLVAMLLLEQSDKRIRRIEQVRRLVPGPIVGTLPRLAPWQARALTAGEPLALVEEAYNLTRANLGLMLRQGRHGDPWQRTLLMVTSALPGEGKSVTSAALARSLARAGRQVILVDADLRRSTQNRLFNSAEETGLAEVLSDHLPLDDALVTSDTPGLLLLHSGKAQRNPTELLSLPHLQETLQELRDRADIVIIDTPACSCVADALFVAPYVDCILNVIRAGVTSTDIVEETVAALQAANPPNLVFFVNSAPRERHSSYKYYRAYTEFKAAPPRTTPPALPAPRLTKEPPYPKADQEPGSSPDAQA